MSAPDDMLLPGAQPDPHVERALAQLGAAARVVGVDEAGRGPLAGPVIAAAVWLSPDAEARALLNDSKKLSAQKRSAAFQALAEDAAAGRAEIRANAASVAVIDEINILKANDLAMRRALAGLRAAADLALIDGSRIPGALPCEAVAVVKGDGRFAAIAAASIVAKVLRDDIMRRLDQRYAGYGWAQNAGYPTRAHRTAIQERGPTPHHRRSFRFAP